MSKINFILTVILSFGCLLSLSAQIYPVSITTQSMPPHSGNISDWTTPGVNRLGVNILLADVNEVNYQGQLKVKIEGQGITLRSKNNLPTAPIELRYGSPLQLNGYDLSEILHYENLIFENYSIQQYESNGGLPDGIYQVCFQVFDYDRVDEEPASFESCVTLSVTLHKTPIVVSPTGIQAPMSPQFVPIQWQPRHTGGFPTEYLVEVFEYDAAAGMTPELIIDFEQAAISKTVMNMNSAIIDVTDPALIPGRDYIVLVQAKDMTNQNGFENNGWSQYETFTYGESSCPPPFSINVKETTASSTTLAWNPIPGGYNNSYVIKYRNKYKANSKWYEDETTGNEIEINDLLENTTYEFQMYTLCEGFTPGDFSAIDTLVTDTIPMQIDCGDPATLPPLDNQELITSLDTEDVLSIGGFKIHLDSISKTGDLWSGNGAVHLSWINTYINVEFEDIEINTTKQVLSGKIYAISDGLDALPGFITGEELAEERNQPEVPVCDDGSLEDQGDGMGGGRISTEQEYEGDTFVAGAGIGATNLPFGLTTLSSSSTYIIALDSMVFSPQKASLKAFIALDIPTKTGEKKHLVFDGETNFHPGGLVGESKMFLSETVQAQLQSKTRFSFIGGENSYVSWDCHGFKSVSIEGSVEFCRDIIIPIDPLTGEVDNVNYVKGSFITTMPEWGDFVATVSISPFALTQKPDWKWEVQNLIFDFSDVMTPETVVFPDGYEHADVIDSLSTENYPAWTGFFIESATVTLPNSLTGVEEGDEVSIGGENVIIDNMGLSAWIYGTELLPLEKGRMGTWAFSIDSMGIAIQSNTFKNLAMSGEVDVPAFEKEFEYDAFIDPGDEYFFKVIWNDTLKLEAFKAKVELHASSAIEINYKPNEKKYHAEAVLHGLASFQPKTEGGTGLSIPYLKFQDLKLLTNEPYVELGSWQLEGDLSANFGAFDITLCGFGITKDEQTQEVIIGFCAKVHLTGASGGELAADGFFRIIADIKYSETFERQIWSYKDFKVDKLGIDASGTGYAFKGDILFFEKDPVYGNGFRGAIEATFQPKLTIGAVAQFGSVDGYKYFFADALASYNPGITMGASGLMLYGFGGGVSYHMARTGFEKIVMPQEGNNPVAPTAIGVSLSGMKYIPKKDVGVGVKATVAIGTVNRTLFNGIATLEFIFNTNGGLHQIGFDGTGKILAQPDGTPKVSCDLAMTFDFPSEAFHASLDVYVDVQNVITGAYANKKAGNGTLHVDPKDWYIYLGTPDQPISLALATEFIPKLDPLKISFGGYFDAGSIIPPFPGLPSQVNSILGDYSITKRDDPRFAGGNGLIFGANMKADLANLRYAIFYASLSAGMGFDMMLYDYGLNARCEGNERSPDPIGIDGWYGTGQMYAYMQGEIGISVDLFLVKGNFKILEIGAAAALQARLPNPMYMRGKVGGYYSILGGAVSGKCSFSFEAGENCTVVGADVLKVDIISDTSPNLNENKEVDVFIRPQATFNFAMGETFYLSDEENVRHYYRPAIEDFYLTNLRTGAKVKGDLIWAEDKYTVALKSEEILDPQTNFEMIVRVKVETKLWGEEWEMLKDGFGDPYFQEKKIKFKTGDAPNYIPMSNVAFSYPVHTQYNFYKDENNTGYVQLVQGQSYLFNGSTSGEWVQKMRLIQDGTILQQFDFSYDAGQKRVKFKLPTARLNNQKITQLVLVAIPKTSEGAVDENVVMKETTLVFNQGGDPPAAGPNEDFSSILLKQRSLENQAQNLNEEVMVALNFRTSKYNTLASKIESLSSVSDYQTSDVISSTLLPNGNRMSLTIDGFGQFWNGDELFDQFELKGYTNADGAIVPPLIELQANLDVTGIRNNLEWYDNEIYPNMTSKVPSAQFPITGYYADLYGTDYSKALVLGQGLSNKVLTDQEMQSNVASMPGGRMTMQYKIPIVLVKFNFKLQQEVANYYAGRTVPAAMASYLDWKFISPSAGDYKYNIRYKKPGDIAQGGLERTLKYPGF